MVITLWGLWLPYRPLHVLRVIVVVVPRFIRGELVLPQSDRPAGEAALNG